jgi:hypothetical protein
MVIFAFIGARAGEKCYWWPFIMPDDKAHLDAVHLENCGYRQMPLTYGNVARWIAKGIGVTLLFFVWTMWKYLFIGLATALRIVGSFLWNLFLLIHRYERVLCAIDGTLGGVTVYLFLISPQRSFLQNGDVVLLGMVLGAGFGVVNYEVLSKRVLRVVPATTQ